MAAFCARWGLVAEVLASSRVKRLEVITVDGGGENA